jgi:hypothetical protein
LNRQRHDFLTRPRGSSRERIAQFDTGALALTYPNCLSTSLSTVFEELRSFQSAYQPRLRRWNSTCRYHMTTQCHTYVHRLPTVLRKDVRLFQMAIPPFGDFYFLVVLTAIIFAAYFPIDAASWINPFPGIKRVLEVCLSLSRWQFSWHGSIYRPAGVPSAFANIKSEGVCRQGPPRLTLVAQWHTVRGVFDMRRGQSIIDPT